MADCVAPIYLPASYNGVFFDAMVAGSEHGRRGVSGELPFGEITKFQDMGIKIRKYSLKGRFQGPSCVTLTDTLIAAVETPGAGTLLHPTRGILTVSCSLMKVTDDIVNGQGETNFDMDFIDYGSSVTGLTGLPIIPSISGILSAVTDMFTSNFSIASVPFFQQSIVSIATLGALSNIASSLLSALPSANNTINVWQALYQAQANSTNDGTWRNATTAINAIQFGFAAIDAYASDPQTEYNTCLNLANSFALSASVGGSAGACQEALYSAIRITCAAYMLRAATQTVSATLQDALVKVDAISTIINEEQANAVALNNNNLYIALTSFEAIAMQALTNYAYKLPPIISYNFDGGIPSLVAAHEIYGDATKNQDLELRNPYSYPFALGPTIYALGASS